jgi:hypothetical protein
MAQIRQLTLKRPPSRVGEQHRVERDDLGRALAYTRSLLALGLGFL